MTYYDGQGFLVRRSTNAMSALELDGASVCVQKGTTSELNFADFFRTNNMKYQLVALESLDELLKAYDQGTCTVLTSDTSQLFAARLRLGAPDDQVVLPDIILKEPLGPFVWFGDDHWLGIVKWAHYAMINAEELGVSSNTVDEALKSNKPDVKRLVGTDENYGAQMTGRSASSVMSEITVKCSNGTSAPAPGWPSLAGSTASGRTAASSMRRRSVNSARTEHPVGRLLFLAQSQLGAGAPAP